MCSILPEKPKRMAKTTSGIQIENGSFHRQIHLGLQVTRKLEFNDRTVVASGKWLVASTCHLPLATNHFLYWAPECLCAASKIAWSSPCGGPQDDDATVSASTTTSMT